MSFNMERPMWFITEDDDGKLHINPTVAQILSNLDQKVAVVGIVGKYRTGKSYLLNLLYGEVSGFQLGSTIQSQTKGIWIWVRPHPIYPECYLVLLDTEGLSDAEKGDETHDNQIFSLATLLTNCLVYNSMGTIDNDAIKGLHFISALTEHIKLKSSDDETGDEYDTICPFFVWVVRDFVLELMIDGNPCTADKYMENALELKKGYSQKVRNFNTPRECLRNFFRWRKCFTVPRPVLDEELIKHLEDVPKDQLSPTFLQQMDQIQNTILEHATAMKIREVAVTGRRYLLLTETYITAINSGAVPCVENAVAVMGQQEGVRSVEVALQLYKDTMAQTVGSRLPLMLEELSAQHDMAEKAATRQYTALAMFDEEDKYQSELQMKILTEYKRFQEENHNSSKLKCTAILDQLSMDMMRNTDQGGYSGQGSYTKFIHDLDDIVAKYKVTQSKGPAEQQVLAEFLEKKKTEKDLVLQADKAMNEKQKELAQKEEEFKTLEQEKQAAEENRRQIEQEKDDVERSHEMWRAQFESDSHKKLTEMQELNEKVIKKREEEHKELVKKELKNKADMMRRTINDLLDNNKKLEKTHKKQVARLDVEAKQKTTEADKEYKKLMLEGLVKVGSVLGSALEYLVKGSETRESKSSGASGGQTNPGVSGGQTSPGVSGGQTSSSFYQGISNKF